MKALWIRTLALAAAAVGYSHAIFGIGGQWAPAPSLEVKGSSGAVAGAGTDSVTLTQGKVSGLNGFGLKLWIDALPFVDVEAGSNVTAYYRIQGPHLVIEYAPQQGEPALHIHTMYRDPTNDYGARIIPK